MLGIALWCCEYPALCKKPGPLKLLFMEDPLVLALGGIWDVSRAVDQDKLLLLMPLKQKTSVWLHCVFKYRDICSFMEQVILIMKVFIMSWELLKIKDMSVV